MRFVPPGADTTTHPGVAGSRGQRWLGPITVAGTGLSTGEIPTGKPGTFPADWRIAICANTLVGVGEGGPRDPARGRAGSAETGGAGGATTTRACTDGFGTDGLWPGVAITGGSLP